MNPLFDSWLKVWDKLTGRRYRYRPDPILQNIDRDTQRFISYVYLYRIFEYRQAHELLQRRTLTPVFHYRHFKQTKSDGTFRYLHHQQLKEHVIRIFFLCLPSLISAEWQCCARKLLGCTSSNIQRHASHGTSST